MIAAMDKWYDWRFYVFAFSAFFCLMALVGWLPFKGYARIFVVLGLAGTVVLMMYLKVHKIGVW